jgi:hypothetical protein
LTLHRSDNLCPSVLLQTAIAQPILGEKIAFNVNIGIDPMCQSPLQLRIETGRANGNLKT